MSLVVNWYQEKTRSILHKYGPGPRVHYHVGVFSNDVIEASNQRLLQCQITQAQEDMMHVASAFWGIGDLQDKRLLDVGAGLGGASLWMAMLKQANVDSLVQFAEHAHIIRSFARICGVSERVSVFQGDAHSFRPARPTNRPANRPANQAKYDVVMAMESPCYFDRYRWFSHLDSILEEGGRICLEDVFLAEQVPENAKPIFDAYWKTDIGRISGYMDAAKRAGFVGKRLDLTAETAAFWRLSAAWIKFEMAQTQNKKKLARLQRSYDSALFHYDYWNKGHYQIALLCFERRN